MRWLDSVQSSIRPGTYKSYQYLVEKRLIPTLGDILLKDLTAQQIQFIYDEWLREGTGIPTIRKAHAVLHHALERASRTGQIHRNICDQVTPPARIRKEMKFWNESEANRFLQAAIGDRFYPLFYLAIVIGARQMELLGLQWGDLDWIRGNSKICRQLSRHEEMFAPIKTRAGNRTVKLGSGSVEVLRDHLDQQQKERRLAGENWQEYDLIFTSLIGTPVHYKNLVDRHFKPLMDSAGVPAIRFHDLRYTAAALMLSNGIPIFIVSRTLGHARPSITSDIYGHLAPGAADGIGQMMDDLISPVQVDLKAIGHELDTKK